jgi:ferric-dicitrate binding protein FerR (iron transport regulator)
MSDASTSHSPASDDVLGRIRRSQRELDEFIRQSREEAAETARLHSKAPWRLLAAGAATGAMLMAAGAALAFWIQPLACH